MKRYSEETKKKIIEMVKGGKTYAEVAFAMRDQDVRVGSIAGIAKEAGVAPRLAKKAKKKAAKKKAAKHHAKKHKAKETRSTLIVAALKRLNSKSEGNLPITLHNEELIDKLEAIAGKADFDVSDIVEAILIEAVAQ